MAGGTQGRGVKRWGGPGTVPSAGRRSASGSVPNYARSSAAGSVPSAGRYAIPFPGDGLPSTGIVQDSSGLLIVQDSSGEMIVRGDA